MKYYSYLLLRMYAYMLLVSMILLTEVVVLFMVDDGMPLQTTLLSNNADNHNRGGFSRQEAEWQPMAVACSQAAGSLWCLLGLWCCGVPARSFLRSSAWTVSKIAHWQAKEVCGFLHD
uniref:Uncharacterized protein n=1 Tax=Triticum urartu TaxID=4572 RepID=A0A8R7Q4M8_TRIUA